MLIDLLDRNLCNGRAGFVIYVSSSCIFAWEAVDAVTHCWMFPSLCSRDFLFLCQGYTNRGAAQLCPIACYQVVYVLTPTQPLARIDFLRTCAKNISQLLNIYMSETHFDTIDDGCVARLFLCFVLVWSYLLWVYELIKMWGVVNLAKHESVILNFWIHTRWLLKFAEFNNVH